MTVDELLKRLADAFPSFNAKALAAWAPVYRARLGHREGPHLADAYAEALAVFEPKFGKNFPVPKDIEAQMPHLPKAGEEGKSGPPIRAALEERHKRRQAFYASWIAGQGAKIKAARPLAVYHACNLAARDLCRNLKPEEIEKCIARALSAARAAKFGALPKTNDALEMQYDEIRADWENPRQEAA